MYISIICISGFYILYMYCYLYTHYIHIIIYIYTICSIPSLIIFVSVSQYTNLRPLHGRQVVAENARSKDAQLDRRSMSSWGRLPGGNAKGPWLLGVYRGMTLTTQLCYVGIYFHENREIRIPFLNNEDSMESKAGFFSWLIWG